MADLDFRTVAGYRMAFRRTGGGEPVLLVHGITTNSFIWDETIAMISTEFETIAVDLLGCGGSDLTLEADYSIGAQADLLADLITSLGIEPCHVVGHDIGGGVTQILAVRHRNLLRSMTLLNPVGYDFWPVQPIIAMRTPVIRQLAMATIDLGMLRLLVKRGLVHQDLLDDELMDRFWDQMSTPERRNAFLRLARALNNEDLLAITDELRILDIPTLILRGEGDNYLSGEICLRLHADIPGSRLETIKSGGHFIQLDEPEWVAGHLADFLRMTSE